MIKKISFYFLLLSSLLALLISLYLTIEHYNKKSPFCIFNNKCDLVLTSKYSEIFNIPISLLGVFYFLIFIFFLYLFSKNKIKKIFLIFYSALGSIVGIILIYIQIFILKNICSYCLTVDLISIINVLFLIFYIIL